MTYTDLTESNLFDMFLDVEIDGIVYDLHNNFDCVDVKWTENGDLIFLFVGKVRISNCLCWGCHLERRIRSRFFAR